MAITHDELRRAVDVTWMYVDVVGKGVPSRRVTRLPASPGVVEDALGLVLAAIHDPVGRVSLMRAAPRTSAGLLAEGSGAMLERVTRCLPEFLSEEDASVRDAFDLATGATIGPDGAYDLRAKPRLDSVTPELLERYGVIQDRMVDQRNQVLARIRARRVVFGDVTPQPGTSRGTGAGCVIVAAVGVLSVVVTSILL